MQRVWHYSYWNPSNTDKYHHFRKSDVLFTDMLANTQGIFKIKRVKDDRWEEMNKIFGE